ncbi:5-formyltetrahydrofolate cyclo-ligase [Paenibacillus kobensis]|uniref:5-formyltetrahydrofolate cyclo-ligase n=1 Tax=Paenibacillus kobensis TaxID=59841 RepID=UPI000FDC5D0E|nr:5-formyltetrahydrofolate cyclo-ligase [Paenibacillus kobensis]
MTERNKGAKAELRASMKARRKAIGASQRSIKSEQACSRMQGLLSAMGASNVLVYIQLRSELDTSPLLEWCWSNGIAVAAPRCEPDGQTMTPYWIRGWDDLKPGAYGIREPDPAAAAECGSGFIPDAVIVPGLAFDRQGGRLGYGAGYYDRYYDQLQMYAREGGGMPPWIGFAYEEQLIESVPTDGHDAFMDAVVTESGVYWSGRRSGVQWNL